MTREEAINEINKVFTSAYANYIVTALTEGATVSDIQRRWGKAYEAGVKEGLEQAPCEDAVSRKKVIDAIYHECSGTNLDIDFAKVLLLQRAIKALPSATPQEPSKPMVEIDLYSVIKQKYIEREVLGKIRERVDKLQKACGKDDLNLLAQYSAFGMVLDIIDEYRLESEVKANENEK